MVNLNLTGREVKPTEAMKEYVERKLTRIEKYFGNEEIDVNVTIKKENPASEIAEMFVTVTGSSFKAVTEDKDLYASFDKDIDILEGQIRKFKTRKEKMQKDASIKQITFSGEEASEVENEIVKNAYYEVKPLSVEDAQIKLEEKKNSMFLTFVNIETGKVNVIYKLKDSKNYGLVEPEA